MMKYWAVPEQGKPGNYVVIANNIQPKDGVETTRDLYGKPIKKVGDVFELDLTEQSKREAERQARIDAENAAKQARQDKINLARRAGEARSLEELKEMVQALAEVLLGEEESGDSEAVRNRN